MHCALHYKYFGPHVGVLYGKYDLLDELTAYKVRPSPKNPPGKFETGTGNFESYAGVQGALEYFEWVGETFGGEHAEIYAAKYQGRTLKLKQAMRAIRAYEFELSHALLNVLEETPGVTVYGPTHCQLHAVRHAPAPGSGSAGQAQHLCVRWQLLRFSRHRAPGAGSKRRHGARWAGALQYNS